MSERACLVKYCPALKVAKSVHGYCAIHEMIVSSAESWDLASSGKMGKVFLEFAKDCERGIYPRMPL